MERGGAFGGEYGLWDTWGPACRCMRVNRPLWRERAMAECAHACRVDAVGVGFGWFGAYHRTCICQPDCDGIQDIRPMQQLLLRHAFVAMHRALQVQWTSTGPRGCDLRSSSRAQRQPRGVRAPITGVIVCCAGAGLLGACCPSPYKRCRPCGRMSPLS